MKKAVKEKKRRNPVRTRENLLQAAIELFASRGYDGVAVDQIVDHAGCNKRMLYHYFGNKDGLYVEVLREVFGKLEDFELKGIARTLTTADAIRELLACYFDFLQQNPKFVRLLMWENLNQARFFDAHPQLLSKNPILERLGEILEQGRANGEIGSTSDKRHLLILLIGVCFIYFSNGHTLYHTLGLDLRRPSVLQQGLQLAQDVVIHGLIQK